MLGAARAVRGRLALRPGPLHHRERGKRAARPRPAGGLGGPAGRERRGHRFRRVPSAAGWREREGEREA